MVFHFSVQKHVDERSSRCLIFVWVFFNFCLPFLTCWYVLLLIPFYFWLNSLIEAFCKLGRLKILFFYPFQSKPRLTSYHTSDLGFRHLFVACSLLRLYFQSLCGSFHSVKNHQHVNKRKFSSDDNHSLIRVSPEIHLMHKRHSFWLLAWFHHSSFSVLLSI